MKPWMLALHAVLLGNLLFSIAMSVRILSGYARRAFSGDPEARWLGRHIAAIAAAHLMLLAWVTARFFVAWREWGWWWIAGMIAIFAVSDYGLVQLYLYRRWRDDKQRRQTAPVNPR